jgi:hypothetical protein
MNTSHLRLLFFVFVSLLCISDAQWYIIKKDYPSNLMNYPNPGKRSIPDDAVNQPSQVGCSTSFSHLHSYRERWTWLLKCQKSQTSLSPMKHSSSSSTSFEDELPSTTRLILHERRAARASQTYVQDNDMLFNPFFKKLLRQLPKNKQK